MQGNAEPAGTGEGAVAVSAGSIALTVLVGSLAIYAGVSASRLWRNPARADRVMAAYVVLPISKAVRRGTVRGAWPRTVVLACVTVIVPIGSVATSAQLHSGLLRLAAVALIVLLITAGVVQLSIILVNRPRWIVPPAMRAEPGVLTRPDKKGRTGAEARE